MISFTQTQSSEIILQGAASQVHCLVYMLDNWRPATNNCLSHFFVHKFWMYKLLLDIILDMMKMMLRTKNDGLGKATKVEDVNEQLLKDVDQLRS